MVFKFVAGRITLSIAFAALFSIVYFVVCHTFARLFIVIYLVRYFALIGFSA
jgi:hypothetical protein